MKCQKVFVSYEWCNYYEHDEHNVCKINKLSNHPILCQEIRVLILPRLSSVHSTMSHIRPTVRVRSNGPVSFQTRVGPGGALHSQWVPNSRVTIIASGTPGRVGEVCDAMYKGADHATRPETPWRPPVNYEWYAKKLGLGPEYVKRCDEWHAAHPVRHREKKAADSIDIDPIIKLLKKYSKKGSPTENGTPQPACPPIDRLMVAWECAGYSKATIELAAARLQFMESQMDVQQQALDAIFGEYPSASKPTPKKKTIKRKLT
jgi:hypothetical protein